MTRNEILNTPEIVDFMIDKSVMVDSKMKLHKRLDELCKLAIKALEQEPCEDCISRQAVLNCFKKWQPYMATRLHEFENELFELPSVNPQKSDWIPVGERLPEDNELVLFSTKTDRVFDGRFFSDNTNRQWYSFCDRTFAWNNVVIAWMPLPEPFEPQESEVKE